MKQKPTFWFCEVWRMNYWYFIGWTADEFIKYCQKNFDYTPEIWGAVAGKCVEVSDDRGCRYLIWVKNKRDISTLAHECLHAANYSLHRAGYRLDLNNDEAQAYLCGAIVKHALKAKR